MEKIVDLRTLQRPTMKLVLLDEANTTIRVAPPTLDMMDMLKEMQARIDAADADNEKAEAVLYELCAFIFSNNRDNLTVTAEELRGKYGVDPEAAELLFMEYLGFIEELKQGKN